MYLKTRDLDGSKFSALRLDARRASEEEGVPESVRVELKSKGEVVRAFSLRGFEPEWQAHEFPLGLQKPTPITEITFVFNHEKVGRSKKGMIELRRLTLEPLQK